MAYADSWGVTPALMKSVPDVSTRWMIPSVFHGWEEDPSFDVICRDDGGDGTVYFESDPLLQPSVAGTYLCGALSPCCRSLVVRTLLGFYVQRFSTGSSTVDLEGMVDSESSSSGWKIVFSQVRAAPHDEQLYLYQLPNAELSDPSSWGWIIGDRYGIDSGLSVCTIGCG